MQGEQFTVHIMPQKRSLAAHPEERLLEVLIRNGIFLQSDCGEKGPCHRYDVDVIAPDGSYESIDACRYTVTSDMTITIPESSMASFLTMEKAPLCFPEEFAREVSPVSSPREYGLAVDIGTTTIAIYLCDLSGRRVITSTALQNSQVLYGNDIMSRITAVAENPRNLKKLQDLVIKSIEWGIHNLLSTLSLTGKKLSKIVAVGNPAMIHIFLGISPLSIGTAPFLPVFHEARQLSSEDIGLRPCGIPIQTLPNVSGFIGGDILAATIAVGMETQPPGTLLIDLGTNGELVFKSNTCLYATACATGPAIEGPALSCGMQAVPGAINGIKIGSGKQITSISTIGEAEDHDIHPRGICGTGILNILSQLRHNGMLRPDGTFSDGSNIFFILPQNSGRPGIYLNQKDVRSVQLGKSSLISAIEFLLRQASVTLPEKIIISGTMGSHLRPQDLFRLGMIPEISLDRVEISGNLAGSGAAMVLFDDNYLNYAVELSDKFKILELATSVEFQNNFIKNLSFPQE